MPLELQHREHGGSQWPLCWVLCMKPDSVALSEDHLFVVGANCAESHVWPSGKIDGTVVNLTDSSAAQIAVSKTWAAVTQKDGYVLQLSLTGHGALGGTYTPVTLLTGASMVPLGEAFWGDILGFTPAHDTDNFAVVSDGTEYPIVGTDTAILPTPPAGWLKGQGACGIQGILPGMAISIFFSDSKGGAFYKSVPLPGMGTPKDITVSPDFKWLAVIYTYDSEGYIAVYSIDTYGDLTYLATTPSVGVAAFSGVAFSE